MLKFFFVLSLVVGMATLQISCSSSSDEEEVETIEASEDGEEYIEEVEEIIDGGDEFEVIEEDEELPDDVTSFEDDEFEEEDEFGLEDDFGDEEDEFASADDEDFMEAPVEETLDDLPQEEDGELITGTEEDQEFLNEDVEADPVEPEPVTPEQVAMDDSEPDSAMEEETPAPAPAKKSFVPVKKIADVPFTKSGANVNSVYIVRPGDTMDAVAEKIYGTSSKADELYSINPNLRRGMKVGDKVYYNSPSRPDDTSALLTFYEDKGAPSQVYVSQEGENIRQISEALLGNERSWMEIWATNPGVESKWSIPAGTELRYWPTDIAVGGPTAADMAPPPPAPEPEPVEEIVPEDDVMANADPGLPPPPPPAEESLPPPPAPGMADSPDDSIPPPPPIETGEPQEVAELGNIEQGIEPPPPPPPPVQPSGQTGLPEESIAPPPPPPPPPPSAQRARPKKSEPAAAGGLDAFLADEFNLMLAAGVLFILVAGALILIRKRRQSKRINLGETQV